MLHDHTVNQEVFINDCGFSILGLLFQKVPSVVHCLTVTNVTISAVILLQSFPQALYSLITFHLIYTHNKAWLIYCYQIINKGIFIKNIHYLRWVLPLELLYTNIFVYKLLCKEMRHKIKQC